MPGVLGTAHRVKDSEHNGGFITKRSAWYSKECALGELPASVDFRHWQHVSPSRPARCWQVRPSAGLSGCLSACLSGCLTLLVLLPGGVLHPSSSRPGSVGGSGLHHLRREFQSGGGGGSSSDERQLSGVGQFPSLPSTTTRLPPPIDSEIVGTEGSAPYQTPSSTKNGVSGVALDTIAAVAAPSDAGVSGPRVGDDSPATKREEAEEGWNEKKDDKDVLLAAVSAPKGPQRGRGRKAGRGRKVNKDSLFLVPEGLM